MPQLTRNDMLIMLDSALEVFQGSQYNRLDNPLKDMWINATIDDFVKDVVDAANKPNPTKRLPMGVLLYNDIIAKYNEIRTLITPAELANGSKEIYITVSAINGNGTQVTVTTTHYHGLRVGDRVTISGVTGGTGIFNGTFAVSSLPSISGDTNFIFLSTGSGSATITNAIVQYEYPRNYQAFILPTNLYHFETSESFVTPVECSVSKTIPNLVPSVYDITSYNDNPFGGGGSKMATAIFGNELRVYSLGRYNILRLTIIYIKAPAKLDDVPTNCDLPAPVHTKIVELTARKIAAFNNNENFQPIATEINNPTQ